MGLVIHEVCRLNKSAVLVLAVTSPLFVTCAESPEYDRTPDELIMVGSLKADLLLMSCLSEQR